MSKWLNWFPVFVLSVGLTIGPNVVAATAWVSIPSTPDSTGKIVIKAGSLAAGSAVTVQIVDPNGTTTSQVENVAADGALRVEYLPGMPGGYQVKVLDQGGSEIGKGSFGFIK